jgi:hypothetical protein
MSPLRIQSLASQLKVVAMGVAAQQARHIRGTSDELIPAVRTAVRAVMMGANDLIDSDLDGIPGMVRDFILDESRGRGRLDVQVELEIAKTFALRTDLMAQRCIQLARLSLSPHVGDRARRFLSRVGRSYVAGFYPESIVMCRGALDRAVGDKFLHAKEPIPAVQGKADMKSRLERAVVLGWLSTSDRKDAADVWWRGNKVIHDDPMAASDALDTIKKTLRILDALYRPEKK